MKKRIALGFLLVAIFSLVGCSTNHTEQSEAQTETTNVTIHVPTDNDATMKAELIAQYGLPFRIWRTESAGLFQFTLGEGTAKREVVHSVKGSFSKESLSWEIENGELVVTGDWNEAFTLDIEAGQAISKIDGAVYQIEQAET